MGSSEDVEAPSVTLSDEAEVEQSLVSAVSADESSDSHVKMGLGVYCGVGGSASK